MTFLLENIHQLKQNKTKAKNKKNYQRLVKKFCNVVGYKVDI